MQERSETLNDSLISNIPLFATIPPDELAQLATELQQVNVTLSAVLAAQENHSTV